MATLHLITIQPVQDCLNLGQHLQPRCLEDRFLPQHTRNEGTAEAHSLQHIISNLPAVLRLPGCSHLLIKEIRHHTSKKKSRGQQTVQLPENLSLRSPFKLQQLSLSLLDTPRHKKKRIFKTAKLQKILSTICSSTRWLVSRDTVFGTSTNFSPFHGTSTSEMHSSTHSFRNWRVHDLIANSLLDCVSRDTVCGTSTNCTIICGTSSTTFAAGELTICSTVRIFAFSIDLPHACVET